MFAVWVPELASCSDWVATTGGVEGRDVQRELKKHNGNARWIQR